VKERFRGDGQVKTRDIEFVLRRSYGWTSSLFLVTSYMNGEF